MEVVVTDRFYCIYLSSSSCWRCVSHGCLDRQHSAWFCERNDHREPCACSGKSWFSTLPQRCISVCEHGDPLGWVFSQSKSLYQWSDRIRLAHGSSTPTLGWDHRVWQWRDDNRQCWFYLAPYPGQWYGDSDPGQQRLFQNKNPSRVMGTRPMGSHHVFLVPWIEYHFIHQRLWCRWRRR